jgi:hypothetical protein
LVLVGGNVLLLLNNYATSLNVTTAKKRLASRRGDRIADYCERPRWSGGYDGGKYEKQRQPAEHDNLLKAAGIEFV